MKKILLFLFFALNAQASTPFVFTETQLRPFSQLNFTWWGFKIYKAQVWTPEAEKPNFEKELLLHIEYQRDFDSQELVDSTLDEWKRLKLLNKNKYQNWLKQLKAIWPDIKKGDSITTYLNKDTTYFYQDDKLLGKVIDKEFGSTFLQIWLHEKSKTSELLKKSE